MLPEVVDGVSRMMSDPSRKESRFFPVATDFIPSCGIMSCTDAACRADTLTPEGCLGRSIWSRDQDFPITFSGNTGLLYLRIVICRFEVTFFSLLDGVFPTEWILPVIIDPDRLLNNLLDSLTWGIRERMSVSSRVKVTI